MIGQFTCNTYNGASVVDYVIVSQDLFPCVQSFSVHNPTELTHHSCLSVVMRTETLQKVKDIMRLSDHPGYMIWNENKNEKLQNIMLSEEVKNKFDTLVVYHLHQKPIWFQTVQMERKNFDWKIPFGARAFHFP